MKEKVAVATVDGKAYFLIINALREQQIPFVSLVPGAPVSPEVKVVITTKEESRVIVHDKKLIFQDEQEPNSLVNEAKRILQGKEAYEKIVVGIDQGGAIGLAIIADGNVIEESNCFSVPELVNGIIKNLRNVDSSLTNITVKIGNGIPVYKEVLESLDQALAPQVTLEVVSESGTNRPLKDNKHSRKIRHISSAISIASRTGYVFPRRNPIAANSRIQ